MPKKSADQKTEAGSAELSEEELGKAKGGGIVFLPVGGIKQKQQPETDSVWVEFEEGDLTKS